MEVFISSLPAPCLYLANVYLSIKRFRIQSDFLYLGGAEQFWDILELFRI